MPGGSRFWGLFRFRFGRFEFLGYIWVDVAVCFVAGAAMFLLRSAPLQFLFRRLIIRIMNHLSLFRDYKSSRFLFCDIGIWLCS